jgi:hypothetical protein
LNGAGTEKLHSTLSEPEVLSGGGESGRADEKVAAAEPDSSMIRSF